MFLRPDWACARARRWCYTDVLSCWPAGTLNVPPASVHDVANPTARLMLVAVSLAWGLSWPAMKIALNEIPPFSMRVGTSGLATIALFALALMQGRTISVKSSVARAHLMVAGCLNIACFTLFAAFAQLATATSRVAILTYTMPIWAALLACSPSRTLGIVLFRGRRIGLCLSAVVRDRAQIAGNHRIPRGIECPGRWHPVVGADPRRATDRDRPRGLGVHFGRRSGCAA